MLATNEQHELSVQNFRLCNDRDVAERGGRYRCAEGGSISILVLSLIDAPMPNGSELRCDLAPSGCRQRSKKAHRRLSSRH